MDDPFITVLFSALEQTRTFVACVHLSPFNCRFVGLEKEKKKKLTEKICTFCIVLLQLAVCVRTGRGYTSNHNLNARESLP